MVDNVKYRNRDWLYEQYVEMGRSITDIANELNVDHTTISKWKRELDISKPSKKVEMDCSVCGKTFTRYEANVERAKYTNVCSRECLYEGRKMGIIKREVEEGYDVDYTKERYTIECQNCGDKFKVKKSRLESENHGKYCSRKCYEEAKSEMMKGENNPQFIDGRSYDKRCYRGDEWYEIRKECYERDNYTCQVCGVKCIGRKNLNDKNSDKLIQAHHIEPYNGNEENNRLDNLITVCAQCHKKIEEGVIEHKMD